MINIFKSSKLWDHIPSEEELRAKLDPGVDPIVRKLPAERLTQYLGICGFMISYAGTKSEPTYSTELLYYINRDNEIVTPEIKISEIILV